LTYYEIIAFRCARVVYYALLWYIISVRVRKGASLFRPVLSILLLICITSFAFGGPQPPKPGARDRCVVCGMFVEKYPDFLARAITRDGRTFFFDGPKDLFRFLLDPGRYVPAGPAPVIDAVFVTDYYHLAVIDARTAYYVNGSDVHGPMGRELIPFKKEAEAKEFLRDHHAKAILRQNDITARVLQELE
jgi:copper chaperone NosL